MTRYLLLFVALLVAPAYADDAKRAADLFTKSLEASGGVETARAIKSRIMAGTMRFNLGPKWPMTVTSKAPNLRHSTVKIPDYGTVVEGFDGTKAWKREPNREIALLTGFELLQKKREARFHRGIELMTNYESLTYKGQQKINGTLYEVVVATYEADPDMTWFLYADTYLPGIIRMPGPNKTTITVTLADYRPVDAQQIPFKYQILIESPPNPEPVAIDMTFTKVTHNPEIDDQLFAVPKDTPPKNHLSVP